MQAARQVPRTGQGQQASNDQDGDRFCRPADQGGLKRGMTRLLREHRQQPPDFHTEARVEPTPDEQLAVGSQGPALLFRLRWSPGRWDPNAEQGLLAGSQDDTVAVKEQDILKGRVASLGPRHHVFQPGEGGKAQTEVIGSGRCVTRPRKDDLRSRLGDLPQGIVELEEVQGNDQAERHCQRSPEGDRYPQENWHWGSFDIWPLEIWRQILSEGAAELKMQ